MCWFETGMWCGSLALGIKIGWYFEDLTMECVKARRKKGRKDWWGYGGKVWQGG